jgi:predicted TIM-barrel fold metal-dependent hydrolase
VENLMWSTDFPHPVTSWPNSRAVVEKQFAGVPQAEREAMLSGNAMRIWNLS